MCLLAGPIVDRQSSSHCTCHQQHHYATQHESVSRQLTLHACLQAQFLTRNLLLIALGTSDTIMQRNMDLAPSLVFFLIYDISAQTVLKVTSNNSDGMMGAYLQNASLFHAADIRNDWERFITPSVIGLHPADQHEKIVTRQWGPQVGCSLVLSFPSCQTDMSGHMYASEEQ